MSESGSLTGATGEAELSLVAVAVLGELDVGASSPAGVSGDPDGEFDR